MELLTATAVFAAAAAAWAWLALRERRRYEREHGDGYDERQALLRARAYRHAFLALIACLAAFAAECVWNGAFFRMGVKENGWALACALWALAAGLLARRARERREDEE